VWWFGALPGGVVLLGFCGWIQRFQILPEERVMRQRFGASYEAYTQQVRPWV
jgi:protein-S-isoprenylcysteine O-methyltransferase Ste14